VTTTNSTRTARGCQQETSLGTGGGACRAFKLPVAYLQEQLAMLLHAVHLQLVVQFHHGPFDHVSSRGLAHTVHSLTLSFSTLLEGVDTCRLATGSSSSPPSTCGWAGGWWWSAAAMLTSQLCSKLREDYYYCYQSWL
jgi:hypothetical protein